MLEGKRNSPIDDLKQKLQCDWPAIVEARETTAKRRAELGDLLSGEDSADANVVVYGSMAREEMTRESDLDWTLLLDKPVEPADLATTQRIGSKIYAAKFAELQATPLFTTSAARTTLMPTQLDVFCSSWSHTYQPTGMHMIGYAATFSIAMWKMITV
jgi:predicted nucleotidyltransferase